MASDFLILDPTESAALQRLLSKLPGEAQDACADDAAAYVINVLRAYPPYRYVTRRAAYGDPWFSDKQRKKVMAMIREGEIKPGVSSRTQTLSRGWKQVGSGRKSFIANETPYGPVVMGDGEQSRMAKLGGHPTTGQVLDKHAPKIERRLTAAAEKAMRKLGAK